MEQHQGKQPDCLGLVGHELDEDPPEPDRLTAQLAPDEGVTRRRGIPLVEDQVDHPEHGLEPFRQQVVGWHPVRDAGVADLLLGPNQPLGERRLGDQECPGDLGGGQPTEGAQRERDLGLDRQGRVAAGEDEAQAIVADRAHLVLRYRFDGGELGLDLGLAADRRGLLGQDACPSESVDRPVPGRGHDPRPRVDRQPIARPALEGDDERLLDRFLGQVEVAGQPDQRRDRPA